MKATITKLALAIAFMALPTVGSAQGVFGAILQGLQQGMQQVLEQQRQQLRQQQQSQQRNFNGGGGGGFTGNANSGLLIDKTYVEGGGSTYAPPVTSSPSGSSTSRVCSACGGKGVCNACRNHIGKATSSSNSPDCNGCNGTGKCYICNGIGRVSN